MTRFCLSIMMTLLRPTSLPVPAVVGIATNGARSRAPSGIESRRFHRGSLARSRTILATSSALPPPMPITASQPRSRKAAVAASTLASVGLPWTSSKISQPAGHATSAV
jgi:hypothetical protein